jgi:hypothetical protein
VTVAHTQSVFFPYIYGDETLRLQLSKCELDGASFTPRWDADAMECDLSSAASWKRGLLQFQVSRDPDALWVPELVPASERISPPVRLVATAHCAPTFRRFRCEGAVDIKAERGQIEVPLLREELAGALHLDVVVVRASPQTLEPHLAGDAAARIIASRRLVIRIDPPVRRPGPGLNIVWESFRSSAHRYRASHAGVLFHLDTSKTEPALFLNSDADPDLYAILKEEAPRGKKAILRNALFSAIAFPVWMCLLRTAAMAIDAEGHIEPGWQRNVLEELARVDQPGCDSQEAMRRFIRDLRDQSGGHAIEERLPVIVAELLNFRKCAEDLAGVLL